jgi:hypothetical protein
MMLQVKFAFKSDAEIAVGTGKTFVFNDVIDDASILL